MNEIQDQGDVYLLANEFEQAKDYYSHKIKSNIKDADHYYKLATVQK
jgi:hypothetical protein